jgi:predicted esterase
LISKKLSAVKKIIAVISIIIAVGVIGSLYSLDWRFFKGEKINFSFFNGEKLFGKYYSGTKNAGIIFLEGFGSDHIALKSIMSDFFELDLHMFVFDFSGQGRSSGILTFDNAATDRLANQVLLAKEQFKALSGLTEAEILLLGHSMGARVALQAATMDSNKVAGLILLGTQLSLDKNVQSSFFTGVDDSSLGWVQNLSTLNPDVNILLASGSWDDILPKKSAYLLYEKLSNTTVSEPFARMVTTNGKIRELAIYPAIFHNYEVYAPKIIAKSKSWAAEVFALPVISYGASKATARIVLCFLVGLLKLLLLFVVK